LVQPNHFGGPNKTPDIPNQLRRHRTRSPVHAEHFGATDETVDDLGDPRRYTVLTW
jgi:hypothetical protein